MTSLAVQLGFDPAEPRGRHGEWIGLEAHDYEGETGNRDHITRTERGEIPVSAIAHLEGVEGERPGSSSWHKSGQAWEDFKDDIARRGILSPVFITVDHGEDPKISEGNQRRDAAAELGMSHIPAEIHYFGHAERQGTVLERSAGLAGDGLAIELTGLAWMHELRNKRGEWAKTPGDSPGQGIHRYVVPDHARLARGVPKNAKYADPADDPVWGGDKPEAANIVKAYEAAKATPGAVEDGRAWYPQMHRLAEWIGQGNAEEGAILLSTYSPQKSWPANMLQAARSGERGRALGPGEGMMISGAQQRKAQAAIDGAGITALMKTSKTHSFARLLARGGDAPDDPYGHVVIDRHALSVAIGRQLEPEKSGGDGALYSKVNGDSRYHEYVADAYRQAAAEISRREGRLMAPYELQAITWLVQKAHNEASGSGGQALSKGRATMTRNAWAAWMDHAARHGIPTVKGVSALSGLAAVLIDLRFDPDQARDPLGRWTKFGGTGQAARIAAADREGFTVSPRTGEPPAGGYMVAKSGHTHTYPESILDDHEKLTRAIDNMIMKERGAFEDPETYLGGWVSDGKLWLDPADRFDSLDEAVAAGRDRNQVAIFDLHKSEEVPTGGSGGVITEHAESTPGLAAWLRGPPRGAAAGRGGEARRRAAGSLAAELASAHGHHIPGTAYTYRHGWKLISGQASGLPWHREGDTVHYHGGLDLPREKVPQLSGTIGGTYHGPAEVIPKFTGWLGRHGVSVTSERADPHSLRPVKATGSYRTVRGLADEIKSGKREPDWKPLLVSSDGYVVDGTQTWAAKMLSDHEGGPKPGVSVVRADVPLERLMPLAAQFMSEIGMPYRKAGEVADPRYQDTMRLHQRPDGTWDPERQKLHEAIIAGALAGVTPVDHPTATFLGGGTASGKSSVFPAGSEANTVHIDSDKIKEQLPEYPPMVAAGDRNAANHVHEESSYLARRIQAEAERRHLNFTLDSTGDGEYGKMRRKIDQARAAGHRVVGRYVTIDTEAAVQRARKRAEETGREVPASVLRENHRAVAGVFRRLVDDRALDRAELWDNTASPPAPRLVGEQTGTGLLVRDQESWRKFLAKGGEK